MFNISTNSVAGYHLYGLTFNISLVLVTIFIYNNRISENYVNRYCPFWPWALYSLHKGLSVCFFHQCTTYIKYKKLQCTKDAHCNFFIFYIPISILPFKLFRYVPLNNLDTILWSDCSHNPNKLTPILMFLYKWYMNPHVLTME